MADGHKFLKEWLAKNGIKQSFFARRIGVDNSGFSQMLGGKVTPSLRARLMIENATNGDVSASAWIDGEDKAMADAEALCRLLADHKNRKGEKK